MHSRRSLLASAIFAPMDAAAAERKKPAPEKDPYADAVLAKGAPPPPPDGGFTIAVLPDTQYYASRKPETFLAQTRWIAAHRKDRRIAAVFHLGDVTNNNEALEWQRARAALNALPPDLPLCLVPGNHDYGPGGDATSRDTQLSEFLPTSFFAQRPGCRGFFPAEPHRAENSYHVFSAGSFRFLVLCLEFGPRPAVVSWARELAAAHKDHHAVLVTHAFTYHDNSRYDWKQHGKKQKHNPHQYALAKAPGSATDGEELWQQLVSPAGNFLFTINGHVTADGLGRLTSPDSRQRSVHQMLVNFQMRPREGDGWLRLLTFHPDQSLQVTDYSPTRNERNESPQNQFTLALAPL